MAQPLKIMCVHGLGDHRRSAWEEEWRLAIEQAVGPASAEALKFRFVTYDPIFERIDLSFGETVEAAWKLARSGVTNLFRRSRGPLTSVSDRLRWTAGYVVAWLEDEEFQEKTGKLLSDAVQEFEPDVILAHSLGSLITYNAFAQASDKVTAALARCHYVTFGSQLGNPFVLGNLTHGRIEQLPVKHWHHLYNEHDDVFTARLRVQGVANFNELLTPFDDPGSGDHAAPGYLKHEITCSSFWSPLLSRFNPERSGPMPRGDPWSRGTARTARSRVRRALLVGIDEYPKEAERLYGCVNDVFAMSATLQDCGFAPEEIRTCLNDRATTEGILSRLAWLTDGAQAGDQLVFFYSGHGARLPQYGLHEEPDRLTETLVPYDFDWTPERLVSDEQIYQFYAQLPYDTQLLMIFDCCHAGSMHRQSGARARGIAPPDDIRHRELKWDREREMWVPRDFEELNARFSARKTDRRQFFGDSLSTVRIGRAAPLRLTGEKDYEKAKAASDVPVGPFLPLIIEACSEEQLSYEYRHGVTSYGAFTFCLTSILRREKDITFSKLMELASERLKELQYDQKPQILGPAKYMNARVPFETGRGGRTGGDRPGINTPRTTG